MGQNSSKQEKAKNKQKKDKNNGISIKENSNANIEVINGNTSKNKTVNVSLSTSKCKYCEKNLIPNKLLRSHLYYCVECYLKKKKEQILSRYRISYRFTILRDNTKQIIFRKQ